MTKCDFGSHFCSLSGMSAVTPGAGPNNTQKSLPSGDEAYE